MPSNSCAARSWPATFSFADFVGPLAPPEEMTIATTTTIAASPTRPPSWYSRRLRLAAAASWSSASWRAARAASRRSLRVSCAFAMESMMTPAYEREIHFAPVQAKGPLKHSGPTVLQRTLRRAVLVHAAGDHELAHVLA